MGVSFTGNFFVQCASCGFQKIVANLRWDCEEHTIKYWDSASKQRDMPVLFTQELTHLEIPNLDELHEFLDNHLSETTIIGEE